MLPDRTGKCISRWRWQNLTVVEKDSTRVEQTTLTDLPVRQQYALDASGLASIVNSNDAEHLHCYSFFLHLLDNDAATQLVQSVVLFEFQATEPRRCKKNK